LSKSPSILLRTDSYKASHHLAYPPGLENFQASLEPRVGGRYPKTLFFGLTPALLDLAETITGQDVDEAKAFWAAHGEPFDADSWYNIAERLDGRLPLSVRSVPEGTLLPQGCVPFVVTATQPGYAWLVTHVETVLSRVWYTSTVATRSFYCKKVLYDYLRRTSDLDADNAVLFKLHDFGARGVSSSTEASLGGMAHLLNFRGTDTVEGICAARRYYGGGTDMYGFSIPALEHSTVIAWGKDREEECYLNFVAKCAAKGYKMVACVSDSYDFRNAVSNIWCRPDVVKKVKDLGVTVVIRPDSGDAVQENLFAANEIAKKVGSTVNSKSYTVLDPVYRLIQGDGNNDESDIDRVCHAFRLNGLSTENIAFGMGAGLLRKVDRDVQRFAYKPTAAKIDGKWVHISKNPATDPSKKSKGGLLDVLVGPDGDYVTVNEDVALTGPEADTNDLWDNLDYKSVLETRFHDGFIYGTSSFQDIRKRAEEAFTKEVE